jgi:hypothetical protein
MRRYEYREPDQLRADAEGLSRIDGLAAELAAYAEESEELLRFAAEALACGAGRRNPRPRRCSASPSHGRTGAPGRVWWTNARHRSCGTAS